MMFSREKATEGWSRTGMLRGQHAFIFKPIPSLLQAPPENNLARKGKTMPPDVVQ